MNAKIVSASLENFIYNPIAFHPSLIRYKFIKECCYSLYP